MPLSLEAGPSPSTFPHHRVGLEEMADPLDRYRVLHPNTLALTSNKRIFFTFLGGPQKSGQVFVEYEGETYLFNLWSHRTLCYALRDHLKRKYKDQPDLGSVLTHVGVECSVKKNHIGILQTRYHICEI